MTEEEIITALLEEHGLIVDFGNRISGPFIPDGYVRIHKDDNFTVVGEGSTLEAAVESLPVQFQKKLG